MRLLKIGLATCLAVFVAPAWSLCLLCSCSVSATSVAFGSFSPLFGIPVDSTGTVTAECNMPVALLTTYSVTLSTGGSGSYSPRKMSNGSNTLNYNLYQDAAHTIVWGDGSGGSSALSDNALLGLLGHQVRNYPIYGRILPNQQTARPGSYTDTITVIVTYN